MKKLIKPLCLLTGLLCAPAVLLHAQVDEKLKGDIVSTDYVHSPLPLDETEKLYIVMVKFVAPILLALLLLQSFGIDFVQFVTNLFK